MTIAHKIVESVLKDETQNCFDYFDAALKIKTYPVLSEAARQIASSSVLEAKEAPLEFDIQEQLYNSFPPQTQKAIDYVIENLAEFGIKNFTDIIEAAESKFVIIDESLREYFGQAIVAKLYESDHIPSERQKTYIDDIKDYISGKDPKKMGGDEAKDFIKKNFGPRPKRKVVKIRGGRARW